MSSNTMRPQASNTLSSTMNVEQFQSIISDLQDRTGQLGTYVSHFVHDSTHSTIRIPRATASREEIEHLDWLRSEMVAASDCVARATDRASRNLGRLRNAYIAINSLPDDILRLIFSFFIGLDVVPIANVCTHWREVCLAAPELWRHLGLENDKWWNYNRTRQFVRLACLAGHPLSITLDNSTADNRVAKLFRSVVHLIQDLEVRSWSTDGDLFQYDFPRLESLSVDTDIHRRPCIFSLPVTFNKLTKFSLYGSKLSSYRALCHYSGLTALSLAYNDRENDENLLTDEFLSAVLRALPDLQCLRLHKVPMAAQEVLDLSSMPRSLSKPFVPLLGLRDLHLVMHPNQLSALLRHIETSPDNLAHFSIALDDSKSDPDLQMNSPRAIAPGPSLFSSPLRQTLPALSTFNSLTVAFSCCVLPFMRGGAEARWGSLSTSATILFHRPDYVEGGGSPFTGNLQHSFDNLVNSILEQGPLSEVRTLVVQCSRTTVPTAAQVSRILRCVPRIRTLVLDVDRSDTHKLIEHLVQARNTSSVPAAPDLQLVVFDLRMLEKDRLRGGLPEALKPLAVRKVAFVGLDLEMRNSWPPDGKIVDSFKAQGLEITWGAAQRSDTWKKILAFGN